MKNKKNWIRFGVIVVVTQAVGILGSLLSGNIKQSYANFHRPPLSPPDWLFGIVWPILFILMAIAITLVYESAKSTNRTKAISLYWVQLFVNFIWPIVFFGFNLYWLGLVNLVVLWILVFMSMICFGKICKTAGLLMLPYLLWLTFATYLNIGVAVLN